MKLPWDSKYLKICFYVILTFVGIYLVKTCMDLVFYMFTNYSNTIQPFLKKVQGFISLFAPLFIGFIICYLFDPIVDFFQKRYDNIYEKFLKNFFSKHVILQPLTNRKSTYRKRIAGTTLTFLSVILVIVFIIVTTIISIGSSNVSVTLESFYANIESTLDKLNASYSSLHQQAQNLGLFDIISPLISQLMQASTSFFKSLSNEVVNIVVGMGTGILNIILGIFISFYLMMDKEFVVHSFNQALNAFAPKKIISFTKNLSADINIVFSGYIRGQLADATIMAVLISTLLSVIGVDFAILIGIFSGFTNIIPYFGAITGFILAEFVALLSGEPMKAIYAGIGIIILQQIDGAIIQPKVVGKGVKLGPVLVIMSLIVGGGLFGIVGMIIAVPVCAIIKIFLLRYVDRKNKSIETKS